MIVAGYHQRHHEIEVSLKIDQYVFIDTAVSFMIPNKFGLYSYITHFHINKF